MTGLLRRSRFALAAGLAAAFLAAPGCGRQSDGSAIRALLEESVARAERKDARGLMELFAPDYRDFQGRDPEGTLRLVSGYLDRYRSVVIHLLGVRVGDVGPDGRASVECEVSLSHGAAEVLHKLFRATGESYRFRFEVRKEAPKVWRYIFAAWEPVGLAELFPESLDILRKLFPGL